MDIPPVTLALIIITALVSIGGFNNRKVIDNLIFYGPAVSQQNQVYRFFTCGLIHADWAHLIFNMMALAFLGGLVENEFGKMFGEMGKWIYLLFYISALAISVLPTYNRHKNDYYYRSLGASGAVSAVIFAGLLLAPTISLYLFFIPIPIPGFVFGPVYLIVTAYLDRQGGKNINHSAHLWGALYGLAFVIVVSYMVGHPVFQNAIQAITAYFNSL